MYYQLLLLSLAADTLALGSASSGNVGDSSTTAPVIRTCVSDGVLVPCPTTTYSASSSTSYTLIIDCFDSQGVIVPCTTTSTYSRTTTYSPIKDCFNSNGVIVPCTTTTARQSNAGCCDTPGHCSCPSTPTSTSDNGPTTTANVACIGDAPGRKPTITVVTIGTTVITVPAVTVQPPAPVTETFCLKDGHSARCPITTLNVTPPKVSCTGSYFNGACQCPCGAACSCPGSSMTTLTSSCSGSYFNGACQCPCGAACSCPASSMPTLTSHAGIAAC